MYSVKDWLLLWKVSNLDIHVHCSINRKSCYIGIHVLWYCTCKIVCIWAFPLFWFVHFKNTNHDTVVCILVM